MCVCCNYLVPLGTRRKIFHIMGASPRPSHCFPHVPAKEAFCAEVTIIMTFDALTFCHFPQIPLPALRISLYFSYISFCSGFARQDNPDKSRIINGHHFKRVSTLLEGHGGKVRFSRLLIIYCVSAAASLTHNTSEIVRCACLFCVSCVIQTAKRGVSVPRLPPRTRLGERKCRRVHAVHASHGYAWARGSSGVGSGG